MSKFSELRGLIAKSLYANPESWRSFFLKYNCDPQSSHPEKEIVKAFSRYGDQVATDVNDILTKSYAGFLGNDGLTSEETLGKIKNTSDALKTWLESIGEETTDVQTTVKDDENDKHGETSWMFIFVGVVFVCVVTFIVVKRIKS